jgi:hypothetical protein
MISNRKLALALAAYALIAVSAWFTLSENMRLAVWVLMGGLALKTLVAAQQLRTQHSTETAESSGPNEIDPHKQEDR